MTKSLTHEQELELISDYDTGMMHREIIRKFGISQNTVSRTLSKHNATLRRVAPSSVTEDQLLQMQKDYENGATFVDVAQKWGLGRERVVRLLLARGVSSRGNIKYPPLSHEQVSEIIERWSLQEQSRERIAREMGLQAFHVELCLRENSYDPRLRRYATRESHPNWKGGTSVDRVSGYVSVRMYPGDPYYEMANGNGRVLEHRIVMARHIGRALTPTETVHHIDGDKDNNDISNLQLRQGRHGKGAAFQCQDCSSHNVVAVSL